MRRPSRTALKIARFMLLLDAVPRLHGFLSAEQVAATEGILLASGAASAGRIRMMRSPTTVRFFEAAERFLGQGQVLWFGVRKRWMQLQVESAIQAGARQLLVVGAGFDPLAAIIARHHPEVLCVEIDAPATAVPKQKGVSGAGFAAPNLVVHAADLATTSLVQALAATPWRNDRESVVVAEGLLMYLSADAVTGFFSQLRSVLPAGSRIAFSAMEGRGGKPHLAVWDRTARLTLRLAGEPLTWGLARTEVASFLSQAGYRVLEHPTDEDLRARLLAPAGLLAEPLLPCEHLVLAELNTST